MAIGVLRRFKPGRGFSMLGRVIHEIRLLAGGGVQYWVQPTVTDQEKGLPHSVIEFEHCDADIFQAAVAAGEILELPNL